MSDSKLGTQAGLIGFIRPMTVLRLAHRMPTVSPRRSLRLLGLATSSVASTPIAAWESLRHGRRVDGIQPDPSPVFIIGHWRSGTTHLHNLMSQDPSFGTLRMFQTLAPDCSISAGGWLKSLLTRVVPAKRPMDEMEWPMDAPQEEEIALAKVTPYSWYLSFLFPRQAIPSFDRFVLMQGADASVREEVRARLMHIYRVATLHERGRRLLLKNPVHTCRIPLLLEMFPDARFVFIHRSPYEVFSSTLHLHRKILELTSLQPIDEEEIEHNVLELHRRVTAAYLRDRTWIRPERLVEVGFDALTRDPLDTLQHIYGSLDLPGFETSRGRCARYLESQRSYRRNHFALSDRAREVVDEHWSKDFDAWGYERNGRPSIRPSRPGAQRPGFEPAPIGSAAAAGLS